MSPSPIVLTILWAVLFALFVLLESASVQLVSIWFAAGALASFLASFFIHGWFAQLLIFVVVSVLLLLLTRPILKRTLDTHKVHTNADAAIDRPAVVTQTIHNLQGTGRIQSDGLSWNARSNDPNAVIEVGAAVVITRIEGVTAYVDRQETIV